MFMDAGLFLVATKLDIYHETNKELTKYILRIFCFRHFRIIVLQGKTVLP